MLDSDCLQTDEGFTGHNAACNAVNIISLLSALLFRVQSLTAAKLDKVTANANPTFTVSC